MKRFLRIRNNIVLVIIVTICSYSCGNSEKGEDKNTKNTTEAGSNSCLEQYVNKPCDLLDKGFLVSEAGAPAQNIEVEAKDVTKISKYIKPDCKYKWPSSRKGVMVVKAAGQEIRTNLDLPNVVIVGSIDVIDDEDFKLTKTNTYEAYFERVYGVKTTEDKENIKKTIDKSSRESDQVNPKSAKTLSKMVDEQATTIKIDGLGDQAVASVSSLKNYENWRQAKLIVMHQNVVFEIEVDVSENDKEDLDLAKKIAEKILASCE